MADISKEDLRKEISAILKEADLSSTSAKKVRKELEDKLDADLSDRKKEIDDLVMEFVSKDKKKKKKDVSEDEEEEEEEEEDEESEEEKKPKKRGSPAKKPAAKKAKKNDSDDEEEASEGGESEEEYSPKKAATKPKGRKLPPKKKKGSDSDSDEDWGKKKGGKKGAAGGAKRGGGGYTKAMKLSPELATLVGEDQMARHEVVKKVWSIIKEKNLYDPKNKQFAICDDALLKVIGQKRFRTFGMMKYLKTHFIS